MIVRVGELTFTGDGPVLRDGGQTDGLRLCIAPDQRTYLFKRYKSETADEVRVPALHSMIRWRRELPDEERAVLDERCAWPIAVVGTPARAEGILIRLAERSMFEQRTSGSGEMTETPRHLDELTRSPDRARRIAQRYEVKKAYYEPPYKLAVLGELLDTVTWLHQHGYAVGDLQLRNAVFTIDPRPKAYLLDCDSCVPLLGEGAMPPVDPEQWKLPVEQRGVAFDVTSDHYKFAWAVVRCVQETVETWQPDPVVLRRVMPSALADTLIECSRTLPPPGVRERLREAAAVWPRMVIGERLYVNVDGFIKKPWPTGKSAVTPAPITATPPVPATLGSSGSPAGSGGKVKWALVAGAVLIVLFLIIIALGM